MHFYRNAAPEHEGQRWAGDGMPRTLVLRFRKVFSLRGEEYGFRIKGLGNEGSGLRV